MQVNMVTYQISLILLLRYIDPHFRLIGIVESFRVRSIHQRTYRTTIMKSLAPFLSVISICSLSIILLGTPITGLGTGYYGWDILQQPDTNSPRKPAFAPLPVEVPESRDDAYNLILSWSKTLANEDDPAGGTKPLPVRERDRFSGLMNHLAITGSTLNAVPSSPESCYQVYRCLYKSLPDRPSSLPNPSLRNDTAAGAASIFGTCTSESANSLFQQDSFECPLKLNLKSSSSNSRIGGNCGLNGPGSDMDKWVGYNVSRNIGVFQNGGVDSEGVWWPGMSTLNDTSFSQALRSELLRQTGPPCSLESVCGGPLTCDDVGTFRGTGVGTPIQTSTWGFMTLTAMFNINMQLKNHYDEMKSALELLGLKAFLIGDFYPKPDKSFGLLDALTGLGTAFSIFGGFIPGAGAALGAAGAIAGGAGSFLSSSIAQSDRSDPLVAQKNFADEVSKIYNQLLSGLDDAAARLFKGEGIGIEGHTFNITDMMRDGAWVGPNVLTNVSELNQKLQIEIMSRSINALWKEFSSNKMWVTFVNLGDGPDLAKCMADTTGPQPFKYCADGGVYYTYNFLEEGVGGGGVGYPWGAQKLQEKFNISMNVSLGH